MLDLETVIDELHAREINGSISWFYDGVWRVMLGDPHNGIDAEAMVRSLLEAPKWLYMKAIELYLDSDFAKQFRP
jgi:hypothetical protein